MSFDESAISLSETCDYVKDRFAKDLLTLENYISTENMLPNRGGVTVSSGLPNTAAIEYLPGDVLVSNIRPYFKKIWRADKRGGCSADVLNFRAKTHCNNQYLYYLLSDDRFFAYSTGTSKGTKMPRGDKKAIMDYPVMLPPLPEQQAIAATLSCLDDKIELNNRMNKTLEEMAQAIFKSWFVDFEPFQEGKFVDSELGKIPKGWRVGTLTEIADYLNGLAMQNYRPADGEAAIPVLKIKELRQGRTYVDSDLCSANINERYVIQDGDIIFSWSGSLLVDIWCGGTCGLNQHLFKVSSTQYNKWYFYMWTKYHLQQFQSIAKDKATTMGHIKRGDLERSKCLIPNETSLSLMDATMSPIIDKIIASKIQVRQLERIRDSLLPKLMSGEIRVPVEVS